MRRSHVCSLMSSREMIKLRRPQTVVEHRRGLTRNLTRLGGAVMKPTTEIWKPIPAFEGLYEASSSGRIRSLDRITAHGTTRKGRVLKGHRHPDGHLTLSLWRDGNRRSCLACSRARSRAKSSDVPFTADLADRYFNSIEAARRGEPATDPLPNKKRRDPVTGRYTAGRRVWPEGEDK